ncbi:MAG TPA: hypothetical protein VHI52_15790, partial [Verrucomicrobiae bacterium]|nr:hypothetical protein [Verrucomicrobiae bacterium]
MPAVKVPFHFNSQICLGTDSTCHFASALPTNASWRGIQSAAGVPHSNAPRLCATQSYDIGGACRAAA